MLHLLNLEALEALLLRVPDLVRRFDDRDVEFFESVKAWLVDAERELGQNRMTSAAEVAACRGELISTERGYPEGAAVQNKVGKRTQKDARAAYLLNRATDVLSQSIRPRRAQFDEATGMIMQIVAVADHLGLIPRETGQTHTAYTLGILSAIATRPELASLVVHVTGLVGAGDLLIVLDRSITAVRQ